MKFISVSTLTENQKEGIRQLWNTEYPVNLMHSSLSGFKDYLKGLHAPSHILLVDKDLKIKGWLCDFTRENERWFAMIVNSDLQGQGYGTKLLNLAKQKETKLNGWVVAHNDYRKQNGQSYVSPIGFYEKNGFNLLEHSQTELEEITVLKIKWSSV